MYHQIQSKKDWIYETYSETQVPIQYFQTPYYHIHGSLNYVHVQHGYIIKLHAYPFIVVNYKCKKGE